MSTLLNPFDHPICFSTPVRLVQSAWRQHVPFAMFLVDVLKPQIIVEIGTHYGGSYCAFCQAVKQLNLDTRCYAIDTWQGDPHSGFYGPEVLAELRDYHDLLYGGFSRLIQSSFDEALRHFGDGTIGLLHIDAYHTYEAVKRDFESWLPKMESAGVILFHDINVRERDFGVRRFWDEIKPHYRHFEFVHGHGLGVLAVGETKSPEFREVLDATGESAAILRDFFFQLGNRLDLKFERDANAKAVIRLEGESEQYRRAIGEREETLRSISAAVAEKEAAIRSLKAQMAEKDRALHKLRSPLTEKTPGIQGFRSQLAEKDRAIQKIKSQLAEKEQASQLLSKELRDKESQLARIDGSIGWRLLNAYGRRIKYPFLMPLYRLYGRLKYPYLLPIYKRLGLLPSDAARASGNGDARIVQTQPRGIAPSQDSMITVRPVEPTPSLEPHRSAADVIVCVHNALEDVKLCLESVVRCTSMPYSLILVDDGSNQETREYLEAFSNAHNAALIRNEQARGYTFAANQGLRRSRGDYSVLLNSDTVVTIEWLDRLIACAESDPRIGLVGPVSNAATWQSIPEIISNGVFAENKLPEGLTVADLGRLVTRYSARLYPCIPFINGFCFMIKRRVIDEVGYFDEDTFGRGYGEENDYSLRAHKKGWRSAIADDAYVYHAQSRSYTHERRKELTEGAGAALAAKHGTQVINEGVAVCQFDRVLEGVRARSGVMASRQQFIEQGKARWEGKRVLFVLPIAAFSGGCNVVLEEAEAMRRMGADVRIANLSPYRKGFDEAYPDNTLPVIWARSPDEVPDLLPAYDAVIATWCASVSWLSFPKAASHRPVRGYYVQSFEPYLFPEGSQEFKMAWDSYTRYPDIVRVTKTEWNRAVVGEEIGVDCTVIGPSVNIDLFRPRRRQDPDWPRRPLRIAAMIRPSAPCRAPELTLEVLRTLNRQHGDAIEMYLFGCAKNELESLAAPLDFSYRNAGILTRPQTASLLNDVDIMVDFSTWQTMGLTAMEAMCCGAAVIVPQRGGAPSFVRHEENGIITDTSVEKDCLAALQRLIVDDELRARLQRRAMFDICQFFPEKAAFNILNVIFEETARRTEESPAQPRASLPEKQRIRPAERGVAGRRHDRAQEGAKARSSVAADRERFIERGAGLAKDKQLLFVLPVSEPSGGANIVLDEAGAMRKMGVDVTILNLTRYRERFERHFPDNTVPVIYLNDEAEVSGIVARYDAAIATWCASVDWLAPNGSNDRRLARGYYIQDFEPHFFREESEEYKMAWRSYTRYPDLVRLTKTEWNRATVMEKIGVDCTVVGPSVNVDLYYPRRREEAERPRRLRIAAMIRPSTPHRAPKFTLEILREFYLAHEETVELVFFGCDPYDLDQLGARDDFPYINKGILTRSHIATLFNEVDIFADFSNYQAMGLTAMEAMCCGAAVIVPQRGGAASFVTNEENGIMIDTNSSSACLSALERLAGDEDLRNRLQGRAMADICKFFPERAAYNILRAMFEGRE